MATCTLGQTLHPLQNYYQTSWETCFPSKSPLQWEYFRLPIFLGNNYHSTIKLHAVGFKNRMKMKNPHKCHLIECHVLIENRICKISEKIFLMIIKLVGKIGAKSNCNKDTMQHENWKSFYI